MKIMAFVLAFLFFSAVPLLAQNSSSIHLTTYYPAPNGDYLNLNTDTMNIRGNASVGGSASVVGHLRVLGNVGLGFLSTDDAPQHRLVVRGNIVVDTDGTATTGRINALGFYYFSDRRLKDNIVTLSDSLEKVLALRGVSFNFKNSPGVKKAGLIAQEVEAVVPEVVATGSDGMKSVEYGNLVALLIEAVKAQQAEITLLKNRVAALEAAGR